MTPHRDRRRGLAIIPAMVCLVLVILISAVLLKQMTLRRASARIEERRMQADWLAESGLARASARLAADRDYKGETWTVGAEALGGHPGVVRISVTRGQAGRREVRVEADYPSDTEARARAGKTLTVEPQTETESETKGDPS